MTLKDELQFWFGLKTNFMNQISEDKNTIESRQKSIELAKQRISGNEKVLHFVSSNIRSLEARIDDSDKQEQD